MTSSDFAQEITLIHRLEQMASALTNPLQAVTIIEEVLSAVADPLPGQPAALEQLASAFRSAAKETGRLGHELEALGSTKLPQIWHGLAATSASDVFTAAGYRVKETDRSLAKAADALQHYASTLHHLQRRHQQLTGALRLAWHDATDANFLRYDMLRPDSTALEAVAVGVASLVRACIRVYRDSLAAADLAVQRFFEVQSAARAQDLAHGGFEAADALVLSTATIGGAVPEEPNGISGR